jgi:Uma2 family endonuclease
MALIELTADQTEIDKDAAFRLVRDTYWTEGLFLDLSEATNHLVELASGKLEVLPVPTLTHQTVVGNLFKLMDGWLDPSQTGRVVLAPHPIRLWPGRFREPDLAVFLAVHSDRLGERFSGIPDLVVEVLSTGTRHVDRGAKFAEYAQAGIPEYWIIDLDHQAIEVYTLDGDRYRLFANATGDEPIRSRILPGFEVALSPLLGV